MSTDQINPEIIARLAVAEKATIGSGRSLTPEQAEANRLIDEQAKSGTESTLKVAADRLDHQQVEKANDKAIGTERDRDGKIIRTGEAKVRYDNAIKETEMINKFLDEGYSKLDNSQQIKVRGYIESIVNSVPALKAVYDSSSNKQAFLEKMALDPDFSHLVADVARGILDPSKIKPEAVSTIKLRVEAINKRLQEIEGRLKNDADNLDKRIKELSEEIKELAEGGEVNASGKAQETKIDMIRGQLAITARKIAPLDKEIKSLQRLQDQYEEALNRAGVESKGEEEEITINVSGTNQTKKVGDFRSFIDKIQEDIEQKEAELEQLTIQKKALESRITKYEEGDYEKILRKELEDAVKEKKDLEKEKRDLNEELDKKKIELVDAQSEREFEEKDYVKRLQNVFSEAAKKYVEKKLTESEKFARNTLTAEAAKSDDKAMAQLKDQLALTLFGIDGKIKIDDVKNQFNAMIKDNNPDEFLRELLAKGGKFKLTDQEIDELEKDPVKWNKLRLELGSEIVKLYSLRGGWGGRYGKIHSEIALKLKTSSWGTEVVAQGLDRARKEVESLTGLKMPASNMLGEWLRKQDLGKWTILLGALGVLALLVFLATKH